MQGGNVGNTHSLPLAPPCMGCFHKFQPERIRDNPRSKKPRL